MAGAEESSERRIYSRFIATSEVTHTWCYVRQAAVQDVIAVNDIVRKDPCLPTGKLRSLLAIACAGSGWCFGDVRLLPEA